MFVWSGCSIGLVSGGGGGDGGCWGDESLFSLIHAHIFVFCFVFF